MERLGEILSSTGVTTQFTAQAAAPTPQHFLYFLPLPQGQASFRPTLGASLTTGVATGGGPDSFNCGAGEDGAENLSNPVVAAESGPVDLADLLNVFSIFSKAAKLVAARNIPEQTSERIEPIISSNARNASLLYSLRGSF
jgi:hypothetical protein